MSYEEVVTLGGTIRGAARATLPDYVAGLSWTPVSDALATATLAGGVCLLRSADLNFDRAVANHEGGALSVEVSPDGGLIASGGQDGRVRIVPLGGKGTPLVLDLPGWVEHVHWSPNGQILAAAAGRTLRFWSRHGRLLGSVDEHESTISGFFWEPDGHSVTTACHGALRLVKPHRRRAVVRLPWDGAGPISALARSPDGRYVATGHHDATVVLCEINTGKTIQLGGYPGKVRLLAFSQDGRYFATGCGDRIAVFALTRRGPAKKQARILRGQRDKVTALHFLTRSGNLLSATQNGGLWSWRPGLRWRVHSRAMIRGGAEAIAVSPDERRVAVVGPAGLLTVIGIEAGGRYGSSEAKHNLVATIGATL